MPGRRRAKNEITSHAVVARIPFYIYQLHCASCHNQGHVGSKTLLQQNHSVLNQLWQLRQVVLYNGHKTVVVVVVSVHPFLHSSPFYPTPKILRFTMLFNRPDPQKSAYPESIGLYKGFHVYYC